MSNEQRLAEAVRTACIKAALDAYEDGGILGLCAEGRWEYAISAMQQLDVAAVCNVLSGPDSNDLTPINPGQYAQ